MDHLWNQLIIVLTDLLPRSSVRGGIKHDNDKTRLLHTQQQHTLMGWAQMHLKQTQSQTAVALPPSRLLDCCDVNGGNERKQFSLHQRLLLPVNLFYFAPNDPPSPGKRIASRRLRKLLRGKGGENFILIAEFMLPFVATATSSKCPPSCFCCCP